MPGSGQWKLLNDNSDQCWHCDQWIYSLIFWDAETIAKQAKKTTHHKVLNQMVKLVESLNPELLDEQSAISLSVFDEDASDFSNSEESAQETKNSPSKIFSRSPPGLKESSDNKKV